MKYINEANLENIGADWEALINVIGEATLLLKENRTKQPVKPYLRFNDPANRIIAMPAYVGGEIDCAGIKWIASFPGNISKSLKRAHSVIVLNDANTGIPTAIINTALLSGIRTASVSGFVLKKYLEANTVKHLDCGIIGFGPIGQLHLKMLDQFFGDKVRNVFIYDLNPIDKNLFSSFRCKDNISVCTSWEEVYEKSDLFITCTVSSQRYINKSPKKGSIYLNVSLRDFSADFLKEIDVNLVDSWDEVCRENTDIEKAHVQFGLKKEQVLEISDILARPNLDLMNNRSFMFNPMGMAIYDIAIAKYYYDQASEKKEYTALEA